MYGSVPYGKVNLFSRFHITDSTIPQVLQLLLITLLVELFLSLYQGTWQLLVQYIFHFSETERHLVKNVDKKVCMVPVLIFGIRTNGYLQEEKLFYCIEYFFVNNLRWYHPGGLRKVIYKIISLNANLFSPPFQVDQIFGPPGIHRLKFV